MFLSFNCWGAFRLSYEDAYSIWTKVKNFIICTTKVIKETQSVEYVPLDIP